MGYTRPIYGQIPSTPSFRTSRLIMSPSPKIDEAQTASATAPRAWRGVTVFPMPLGHGLCYERNALLRSESSRGSYRETAEAWRDIYMCGLRTCAVLGRSRARHLHPHHPVRRARVAEEAQRSRESDNRLWRGQGTSTTSRLWMRRYSCQAGSAFI